MKPTTGLVLVILVLLGGVLLAPWAVPVALAQDPEPYLRSPQGPYRGRVVDAETGQPLSGALVIAIWQAEDVQFKDVRRFVAVREVLTDAAGQFVLDASAIEASPPPRMFPPRLFIYTPGYTSFPGKPGYGAPAAAFVGTGSVVRLRQLTRGEEQAESFIVIFLNSITWMIPEPVFERSLGFDRPRGAAGRVPLFARTVMEELKRIENLKIDESSWLALVRRKRRAEEPACPSGPQAPPQRVEGAAERPHRSGLWERYVQGYHGPYRGRVIDAETKRPLMGAVVVAIWSREVAQIVHSTTYLYEVCEALTDANGEFVLHAEDVERHAPPRTLRPIFVIFFPGYQSYPGIQGALQGVTGRNFEGAGATVELPPLKTREERLKENSRVSPFSLSDAPFKDIPHFMRLLNSESVSLGLRPYQAPERRP